MTELVIRKHFSKYLSVMNAKCKSKDMFCILFDFSLCYITPQQNHREKRFDPEEIVVKLK